MALHEEQLANRVIDQLRANLPVELATTIAGTDASLPIHAPRSEDYYVGNITQYRAYHAPAVFIIVNRVNRPGEGRGREWNVVRYQELSMTVLIVVEGAEEEKLTRASWRYAEAADAALHNQEVLVPAATTTHSHKLFVVRINYGALFTRVHQEQRVFRKDVRLEAVMKHWDQLTPMAA